MSEAKTWKGSCHCGRIAFEVEGTLDQVTECNCSICRRKGTKMWFVPRTQLHLFTPETDAATYTFGKHHIKHRFCPVCGIHVFGEASKDGVPMAAINVRCLEMLTWRHCRCAISTARACESPVRDEHRDTATIGVFP